MDKSLDIAMLGNHVVSDELLGTVLKAILDCTKLCTMCCGCGVVGAL